MSGWRPGEPHPEDCDCSKEYARALVGSLSRGWRRRRVRGAVAAIAVIAAAAAFALLTR